MSEHTARFKVEVSCREENEAVQQYFFEQGYGWGPSNSSNRDQMINTNKRFLYVEDDGSLSYSNDPDREFFDEVNGEEIFFVFEKTLVAHRDRQKRVTLDGELLTVEQAIRKLEEMK